MRTKYKTMIMKEDLHNDLEKTRKKLGFRSFSDVLKYLLKKVDREETSI